MVCSNSDIDLYRNKQHFKLADIVIARDHRYLLGKGGYVFGSVG